MDRKGRIWFADPHSATFAFGPQFFPPLDHASVLRLEKDDRNEWALERVTFDTKAPRAVLLSADEKTLYVAEGEPAAGFVRELRAYPVLDDGSVGIVRGAADFGADHRGPQRGIEGMCLDVDGNIVACGGWRRAAPGRWSRLLAEGAILETHALPADLPNRCCFGGKDLETLYVTTAAASCTPPKHRAAVSTRAEQRGGNRSSPSTVI